MHFRLHICGLLDEMLEPPPKSNGDGAVPDTWGTDPFSQNVVLREI